MCNPEFVNKIMIYLCFLFMFTCYLPNFESHGYSIWNSSISVRNFIRNFKDIQRDLARALLTSRNLAWEPSLSKLLGFSLVSEDIYNSRKIIYLISGETTSLVILQRLAEFQDHSRGVSSSCFSR